MNWIPYLDELDPLPGQCCPYATSSPFSIDRMLQIANTQKDDVLLDIGCGDGRIAIYAAKHYGIRAIGIDINPDLLAKAAKDAKQEGVEHLVSFKIKSFADESFDFKLKNIDETIESVHTYPTIFTCYLIPQALKLIEQRLKNIVRTQHILNIDNQNTNNNNNTTTTESLENNKVYNTRVVAYIFDMERWTHTYHDEQFKIFLYNHTSQDKVPVTVDSQNPWIL
ncbi:hypothetical protein DFA_12022 [Cavenderia fasciculata]|uniref:Methyltransferase domain-containing protein n=1 Tax=Cavenderia fasciculata TaxID=261658 RepID=F4QFF1_CACFS|nr:uncharacterized protein DFA_12022 [Cavenderia fasciculata]EGG14252.1 hypothetical protein DFA_12022 [Cavenderia fasciculata]|eukprot:XP_004350961.1 hypothetical protein DFA_12022 [Cavenderia fasciculata]